MTRQEQRRCSTARRPDPQTGKALPAPLSGDNAEKASFYCMESVGEAATLLGQWRQAFHAADLVMVSTPQPRRIAGLRLFHSLGASTSVKTNSRSSNRGAC